MIILKMKATLIFQEGEENLDLLYCGIDHEKPLLPFIGFL
jgi:hypothetical protein